MGFVGKVQAVNVLGTADPAMRIGRTAVASSLLQRKCRLSSPAFTMLFPRPISLISRYQMQRAPGFVRYEATMHVCVVIGADMGYHDLQNNAYCCLCNISQRHPLTCLWKLKT
jgi:hypothetical protein